ncbi:hypothetical protein BDW02DRAFT_142766 [Decorospora gaudefroyi]|uniref:Exonuclease domain-containing protein n=1 Tax=Decorospora gaudefroyi TaxID=184978 RepID=A0A6A5K0P6_9PLEO|nr:hypothetical protein BDW02DRAFT_142766 [Decorospora gaudefroyi]
MWPSVPAHRSFGNVPCPSGAQCELPHCIFNHEAAKPPPARPSPAPTMAELGREPNAKRLKLDHETKEAGAQATPAAAPAKTYVFVGSIMPKSKAPPAIKDPGAAHIAVPPRPTETDPLAVLPPSAARPISPLPAPAATVAKPAANSDAPVPLMPRKLSKEPAAFIKRVTFLKALHGYMKPQNDKLLKAVKPEVKELHLRPNQLNKLAVDEEENIARENPFIYENILKQRLVKLKAMTPEVWVKERREALAKESGEPPKKLPPKNLDTGLTPKEEITFLSMLKCPQDGLDAHGYVTKQPTDSELNDTHLALEVAAGWEQCDRCSTRFQVFPERREEDGALTSGGQCRHHWGKRIFPKRSRNSAPEPTRFACCNAEVGSPGCATHDTHVFNVKDSKRLSLIMPFIKTPENDKAPPDSAVCFDCEMGYTTNGLEMLRLTVISWPQHRPLLDVLVRPLGHLLDVNTRFSGITPEQFVNAKPYDPVDPKLVRKDLRIVDSPCVARDIFLSHVSPTTPVLGHALENDLNTIRLIHPTIIDTVLLYPTRQGLPYRHGLRYLAKTYLGEDIQQGGAAGHDSYEDARTTGELVRFKIKEKWKMMKIDGWQVREDGVFPPMPVGSSPPTAMPLVPEVRSAVLDGKPAEKRKLEEDQGQGAGEEPPVKKQG